MKLYIGDSVNEVFNQISNTIKNKIDSESEEFILNVNEVEFVNFLLKSHLIELPTLHFDSVQIDSYEREIPAEQFPFSFNVSPNKKYPRDIIRFHIPYSGNIKLLSNRPTQYTLSGGMEVSLNEGAIVLEYINFK